MQSGPDRPGHRAVVIVAAACFFLSGVAGLIYEVVWTRLLGLVFGHTVYAITTVLAAYMGGLALGSFLIGRRADGLRRPLRAYGWLEAAIGVYCLATPWLFRAADAVYLWTYRRMEPSAAGAAAVHLLLSAVLLLPPTTLMGATLPILSRAVVRADGLAAAQVGALYSINTWGAVLGTMLAGFLLLPAMGVQATIWLGVGLNLTVAVLALLVERSANEKNERRIAADGPAPDFAVGDPATRLPPAAAAMVLFAIAVSGAASMGYEIAWTRALSLVLGSSTYAFAAMLTTFLVGLAAGAAAVSAWMRNRRPGLAAFGWVEVAIALSTVSILPLLGRLPDAVLLVLRQTGVTYGTVLGTQVGLSFAVMLVPTLLIGATFPLAIAALDRGRGHLGRDVGAIYGANTVGTIVGSIATGFVLIRTIGIQNTVVASAAANMCVGLGLLLLSPGAGWRKRSAAGVAAAGFAVLALTLPHWDPGVMTTGVGVYADRLVGGGGDAVRKLAAERELLFYDEGISTTVSVARDPTGTILTVNGKADASNDTDMPTQVLSGHIGPLLEPGLRRALIVGLASGVTVGAVAQHPFDVIDVAELEPAMIQASRFFRAENRDVLKDPRVRVLEGDGRSILATAAEPYDLIVSEPSNPWIAGVASLFTRDFYLAARNRLSPRGVFVQWLQNYSIFSEDMKMVVRTFQEVFPHVSIWRASTNDFLLVATPGPAELDFAFIEKRLAESPGLRDDFERFKWNGENLAFRFFLGEEDASRYAVGASINTDDLPLLEFSAPKALFAPVAGENERIVRSFRTVERPRVRGLDPSRYTGTSGHLRAAEGNWISGYIDEGRHQLSLVPREGLGPVEQMQRARLLFLLGQFEEAGAQLARLEGVGTQQEPQRSRYAKALGVVRQASMDPRTAPRLAGARDGPSLRAVLGELFLDEARRSRDPDLLVLALEQIQAEAVFNPGSYQVANNYAGALYEAGRLDEAVASLRRAVILNPSLATAHYNLGVILEKQGKMAEAVTAYEEATRLDPADTRARQRLQALRGRR